jgi:hypothetical protein
MKRSQLFLITALFLIVSCRTSDKKNSEFENELSDQALELGEQIAMETQKILGKQLKTAIQAEGIPQALKYCNLHAYPLVDSLENKYQVSIKRASTFTRNPQDKPDEEELNIINDYLEAIRSGKTPEAYINIETDEIHFAKPIIMTDQICLKCHGEVGKDIKAENYEIIKALYPNDKAAGHQLGDLRGIWSIHFRKSILEEMRQ